MEQSLSQGLTEKQKEMDLQLLRISKYHSIIISKNLGSILLLISLTVSILLTRDSVPAFYVLAANNLLPFLFSLIFEQKKEAEESILPLFSKKYKYTRLNYQCNSISYVCVFLLLFLWQKRELKNITSFCVLSYAPVVILFVMFLLRVCGNIYFHRKFKQMLINCNY